MKKTLGQLLRYGIIGLMSNALGYALYLGLTYVGLGPKLAMSLLYVVGVLQTFFLNRRWTFEHDGRTGQAFRRYVVLYASGYVLQLLALSFFVDWFGFPHQWVMLALIIFMALFLFAGQKVWVFRPLVPV